MKQFSLDITNQYMRLKELKDKSEEKLKREKWELSAVMKELKKEFDCDNLKQAEKLYEKINSDLETHEANFKRIANKLEKMILENS